MASLPSWGSQPDRSPKRQPAGTRRPAWPFSFLGGRAIADTECRIANELPVIEHLGRHAHLLFRLLVRNPPVLVPREHERLRKDLRIVNGHDHLYVIVVDARVALLDLGVDAVRMAGLVEPRLVGDADGVDDERVIVFPAPDRIS